MTAQERREFGERARAADARVRDLVRRQRALSRQMVEELYAIEEGRLHEFFPFSSVVAYALDRGVAQSASQVRQMLLVARRIRDWPLQRLAFERDEVDWTKLRETLREAIRRGEGADESELLEDARTLSNRKLERKYRAARGEPDTTPHTFELAPLDEEAWQEARALARKSDPAILDSTLIGLMARAFVKAQSLDASSPAEGSWARIVLHAEVPAGPPAPPGTAKSQAALDALSSATRVTQETRDGPVEVSKARVEEALCNAEINDLRRGPARITRTARPTVARYIHDRDRGRCRAPKCSNRGWLHMHHQGGRRVVGHDPAKMLLLCDVCHRMCHDGKLDITPVDGGFLFRSLDGSPPVFVAVNPAGEVPANRTKEVPAA